MSDSDLLAQIANLAGAINRHKNAETKQDSTIAVANHTKYRPAPYKDSRYTRRPPFKAFSSSRYSHHLPYPSSRIYKDSREGHASISTAGSKKSNSWKRPTLNTLSTVNTKNSSASPTNSELINPADTPVERLDLFHDTLNHHIFLQPSNAHRKNCPRFTKTGTCSRGLSCHYAHDPNHVALCKYFLAGSCKRKSCNLSHNPTAHNTPLCSFFINGHCSNKDCRYYHDTKNLNSPICESFAYTGYCDSGKECEFRHVFECPEFESKGFCSKKNCKLRHIHRAGTSKETTISDSRIAESNIDVSEITKYLYLPATDPTDSTSSEVESHEQDNKNIEDHTDDSKDEDFYDGSESDDIATEQDFIRI